MAKRSANGWNNELAVATDVVLVVKQEPEQVVQLTLLKDLRLRLIGKVTGKEYIFNGAGSSNYVNDQDANLIIAQDKHRKSCCGTIGSLYFEVRS